VSCPDWRRLAAHRLAAEGEEPSGWAAAMAHLDACDDCRRAALAADPSLLFRRLPGLAAGRDEVAAMREAVAALRRASRVASPAPEPARRLRAVAAAGLVVAALGLLPGGGGSTTGTLGPAGGDGALASSPLDLLEPAGASGPTEVQPIDGLNLPDARVYQLAGDNLPVVMSVDASLDV
jgi:hypothetical protein